MTDWPTLLAWRHTSNTKVGSEWWPKGRVNTVAHLTPQDGVAALAAWVSRPAAPTVPTMVSAAEAAKTLLLMDMCSLSGTAAVPCAQLPGLRRDCGLGHHATRPHDSE